VFDERDTRSVLATSSIGQNALTTLKVDLGPTTLLLLLLLLFVLRSGVCSGKENYYCE